MPTKVSNILQNGISSLAINNLGTASGTTNINLSSGNYIIATSRANTTWTVSNISTSSTVGFILQLTSGGSFAQIWPSNTKWPAASAPLLTATGIDVLSFITSDGGTTWRGVLSMGDSR